MHSILPGRDLAVLAAIVAGIVGCANDGVTQPSHPVKLAFVVQPSAAGGSQAITGLTSA